MSQLKFLLKFGKKQHIEEFIKGSLFCSNAETFWEIEKDKKIKGQGDILEAGSRMFAQRMIMQEHGTGKITEVDTQANILLHFQPAQRIPVFCLFSVYECDCRSDSEGNYTIDLSEATKDIIREHFPNADTVAIISNTKQFIEDIAKSIGCRIEHGSVQYFHIDEGFETENGRTANDMEYMKYLTQDCTPVYKDGKEIFSFKADNVFRSLFCKDVYFEREKEYRIVLPDETIVKGTHYPVKLSENIRIMPLKEFMQ